jgi:glyoxylate/hydroxypyruvate reductase
MSKLEATNFELIVNPVDGEPTRAWVLEKVADPEVVAACIMHGQPSDKIDREFLDAASPNLKVVSTFSVGLR